MCPKCQGFAERVTVRSPHEYYDLVRQIEQVVSDGTLALVAGSCKLAEIRRGTPWPADYIEHTFRCVACEQKFQLAVKTYHGSGGDWSRATSSEYGRSGLKQNQTLTDFQACPCL